MTAINKNILYNLNSTSKEKMENAFNIVYKEYSYLVYYISLKIVRDSDMAQEITNETFTIFFINKEKIDSAKNIKYYLITICKNLSINYKNKHKNIENIDNYNISLKIKTDYFSEYVEKFKEYLNEEEVDILILHFLYDFSFKEIANDKQVTTSVISSKYRRAILKVKQHYKSKENIL